MLEIESIFKLTAYEKRGRRPHYPHFRIAASQGNSAYYRTVEEAEQAIRCHANPDLFHCWTLRELPLCIHHRNDESLSERVYLPDGTLWSHRSYAYLIPSVIPQGVSEIEFDNYIYLRGYFHGRKPDEIRFKKGDIIEMLCYEGNQFWGEGSVELAIVVDTPPTVEEISAKTKAFLFSGENLTGHRGFDLGTRFNALDDCYTIIPASLPARTESNLLDSCPTHCAMPTILNVAPQTRRKLERLLEKQEKKNKKQ